MGFKDILATVKNEANDAVEVTKRKTQISKEKTNIKTNYEKLGEKIYEQYKDGEAPEDIAEAIAAIKESKEKIETLNQEIEHIKTTN